MTIYGIHNGEGVIAGFVAPMAVRSNQPTFTTDALSLKRSAFRRTAQRWEIQTNLIPLTHTANQLFALFVGKGHTERFRVVMPQNVGVLHRRTAASNRGRCSGLVGADKVSVSQLNGHIPMGTFIRFSDHSKVYMTTKDFTNGNELHIYPGLRQKVTEATFKCNDDVMMEAIFDLDTVTGMVFVDGILMDNGQVKILEAL